MANYVLHELHKGMGKGENVLYPKMQVYTKFDYDKVVEMIHDYSPAFSKGAIRGVLDGLAIAMKNILPNGHSMKIDGLGVFSLSLGFCDNNINEQDAETTQGQKLKGKKYHVCAKSINFKVDKELMGQINRENTFEKADSEVHRYAEPSTTIRERQQRALQMIRKRGFITLTDYANTNRINRSKASAELKSIVSDPESGITSNGSGSHKIWVEKK